MHTEAGTQAAPTACYWKPHARGTWHANSIRTQIQMHLFHNIDALLCGIHPHRGQASGTVVLAGAGAPRCASNGTVVPDYSPAGVADSGGRMLILMSLSCVHKVRFSLGPDTRYQTALIDVARVQWRAASCWCGLVWCGVVRCGCGVVWCGVCSGQEGAAQQLRCSFLVPWAGMGCAMN